MGIELSFLGSTDTTALSSAKGSLRGKGSVIGGDEASAASGFMAFLSQFGTTAVDVGEVPAGNTANSSGLPAAKDSDLPAAGAGVDAALSPMDPSAVLLQMQMSMKGAAQVATQAAGTGVSSSDAVLGGPAAVGQVRARALRAPADQAAQDNPPLAGGSSIDTVVAAPGIPIASQDATGFAVPGSMALVQGRAGQTSSPTGVGDSSLVAGQLLENAETGSATGALVATDLSGPGEQVSTSAINVTAMSNASDVAPSSPPLSVLKALQREGVPRDPALAGVQSMSTLLAADWRKVSDTQEAVVPGNEKTSLTSRPLFAAGAAGLSRDGHDSAKGAASSALTAAVVAAASGNDGLRQSLESLKGERLSTSGGEGGPAVPVHRGEAAAASSFDASLLAAKTRMDSAAPESVAAAATPEQYIAQQVSVWIGQNVQSAELKLDALGHDPVEVSIALSGNEAQVQFRTDAPETRELLGRAVADLNTALQREGLVLSSVSVGTSDQPKDNAREAGENARTTGTSRRQSEGLMASEGVSLAVTPRRAQGAVDLFV